MYVVTVEFELKPDKANDFRDVILTQARNSLELEPGCEQFEVCLDPENPAIYFLYEVYDDENAFQQHLKTEHFAEFDKTVKPWIERKSVRILRHVN